MIMKMITTALQAEQLQNQRVFIVTNKKKQIQKIKKRNKKKTMMAITAVSLSNMLEGACIRPTKDSRCGMAVPTEDPYRHGRL